MRGKRCVPCCCSWSPASCGSQPTANGSTTLWIVGISMQPHSCSSVPAPCSNHARRGKKPARTVHPSAGRQTCAPAACTSATNTTTSSHPSSAASACARYPLTLGTKHASEPGWKATVSPALSTSASSAGPPKWSGCTRKPLTLCASPRSPSRYPVRRLSSTPRAVPAAALCSITSTTGSRSARRSASTAASCSASISPIPTRASSSDDGGGRALPLSLPVPGKKRSGEPSSTSGRAAAPPPPAVG